MPSFWIALYDMGIHVLLLFRIFIGIYSENVYDNKLFTSFVIYILLKLLLPFALRSFVFVVWWFYKQFMKNRHC